MNHLSGADLRDRLERIPRAPLATLPTPVQPLARMSRALGGPHLVVARDDLTGLAFGGNKIRQLEYLLAPAVEQRASILVAGGGARQSNHARACAASARALGIRSVLLVRPGAERDAQQGNALLMDLLADEVRVLPELADLPADRLRELEARRPIFERVADELRSVGETPFVLHGTSVPLGAIAYVSAFLEIVENAERIGVRPDVICVTSMGVTQAGLALAAHLTGWQGRVVGFAYAPTAGAGREWIARLANDAAQLLGAPTEIVPDDIDNDEAMAGPAYGVGSDATREAIHIAAKTEGLLLDPVYTAKGMAGLIARIRTGEFRSDQTVLFVHTGGLPAIFAYPGEVLAARTAGPT